MLVVGCGDVGLRVARDLGPRVRRLALTSSPERKPALRAAGLTPLSGNLDDPLSLRRLAGLATRVVHLAPPPGEGHAVWWLDPRTRSLARVLPMNCRCSITALIGAKPVPEASRMIGLSESSRRKKLP